MRWPAYAREVAATVASAASRLHASQADDGFWRDYALPPGASESWSTAWVLSALLEIERDAGCVTARRAGRALLAAGSPGGWGYNRSTGPDADSTAWTLRALAALGAAPADAWRCLERYVDRHGRAHTFLEADAGDWGGAHADVTAMVGLSLLATRAPPELTARVRRGLLELRVEDGLWPAFWWSGDAYAVAWALEFLRRSGGVPQELPPVALAWLESTGSGDNALDTSHRLLAALALGPVGTSAARALTDALLELGADGAWPPSPALLVPPKWPTESHENVGAHADSAAIMTTAVAALALTRWSRAAVHELPSTAIPLHQ